MLISDRALLTNCASERERFSIRGICMHAVRRSPAFNINGWVSVKSRILLVNRVGDVRLIQAAGNWRGRHSSARDGARLENSRKLGGRFCTGGKSAGWREEYILHENVRRTGAGRPNTLHTRSSSKPRWVTSILRSCIRSQFSLRNLTKKSFGWVFERH